MSKSLEYMDLKLAEIEKFAPLLMVLDERMDTLDKYIKAGKKDVAFQAMKTIEEQIKPPFDKLLIPFGYLEIYLELEDADNAEKAIEGAEAAIQAFRLEAAREVILGAQGKIHEMRSEYKQAILSFQKQLELKPTDSTINRNIGRCFRKLKDFKKAEEYVQKTLKIYPFGPDTNYEMALVYYDMSKKTKALEHLKRALLVWEEADPEYKPAKKARETLAEWESS
jgi:tetratricopeptide (TPR) repeat protein